MSKDEGAGIESCPCAILYNKKWPYMDTERSQKNILNRLDAVELNMLMHNVDYAKEYLTEEGINVEEEQKYALQFLTKVRFQVKAISAKKEDQ